MTTDQRIEQLERRCRFLTAGLAALALIGGGVMFCGAAQNNVVKEMRVESLEIVDGDGKVRMRLGRMEAPKPHSIFGLVAHDASGRLRISLNDLGQLNLTTRDGSASIGTSDNGAVLQLSSVGTPRMLAAASADHSSLMLYDAKGELAWEQITPRFNVPREQRNADPFKP